jgi:hypothetical protein
MCLRNRLRPSPYRRPMIGRCEWNCFRPAAGRSTVPGSLGSSPA